MVSAVNGDGRVVAGPLRANTGGEYVLAGLPETAVRVRATCDTATVAAPLGAPGSSTAMRVDLFVRNFRPEVRGFLPTLAGRPVRRRCRRARRWTSRPLSPIAMAIHRHCRGWRPRVPEWRHRTRTEALRGPCHANGVCTRCTCWLPDHKGGIRQGQLTLNVGTELAMVLFGHLATGPGAAPRPAARRSTLMG